MTVVGRKLVPVSVSTEVVTAPGAVEMLVTVDAGSVEVTVVAAPPIVVVMVVTVAGTVRVTVCTAPGCVTVNVVMTPGAVVTVPGAVNVVTAPGAVVVMTPPGAVVTEVMVFAGRVDTTVVGVPAIVVWIVVADPG